MSLSRAEKTARHDTRVLEKVLLPRLGGHELGRVNDAIIGAGVRLHEDGGPLSAVDGDEIVVGAERRWPRCCR